jgi:sec-independent protein translocase protein TatA
MPIGTWELVIIFLAVLLLFGGKKIPEIARGLGKGMREFKRAASDIQRELDLSNLEAEVKETPQTPIPEKAGEESEEKSEEKTKITTETPSTDSEEIIDHSHEPGPEVETEGEIKGEEETPITPHKDKDQPDQSEDKDKGAADSS